MKVINHNDNCKQMAKVCAQMICNMGVSNHRCLFRTNCVPDLGEKEDTACQRHIRNFFYDGKS